jgi:hypothetical protein
MRGCLSEGGDYKFTPRSLYEALQNMIAASLQRQNSIGAEFFVNASMFETQRAEFQAADSRLLDIYQPLSGENTYTRQKASWLQSEFQERHTFFKTMCSRIRHKHDRIYIEGPERRGDRSVELRRIYVPTPLTPSSDIFFDGNRAVVLGDPGGGKSTLSKFICLERIEEGLNKGGSAAYRVEVRSYAAALKRNPQLSIFDFIVSDLQQAMTWPDEKRLAAPVGLALRTGEIMIAFDGLDEVLEVADRRFIVDAVVGFSEAFPFAPILVTARKVGYQRAPLPQDIWEHFELGRFGVGEIEKYVLLSSQVAFGEPQARAEDIAASFMNNLSSEVRDLVQNPLMLSLMVWLFHEGRGELPNNRAEVYRECSRLMFERWDKVRKIEPDIPDDFDLLDLITHIAARMYLDQELSAGMTGSQLEDEADKFFLNIYTYDARARARRSARKVVDHITGRAWVMTDIGTDLYDFTHRTFLEYFFARYLNDTYETVVDLLENIAPKVAAGQWVVPAHLTIQMKIAGRPSGVKAVVNYLENSVYPKLYSGNTDDVILFTIQMLRYLPASEADIERISQMVVMRAARKPAWESFVVQLLTQDLPRSDALYRGVSAVIATLVAHKDEVALRRIIGWVYWSKISISTQRNFSDQALDLQIDNLPAAVKEYFHDPQHPWQAKMAFDMNGFVSPKVETFGIKIWELKDITSEKQWIYYDFALIMFELEQLLGGKSTLTGYRYAKLGLAMAPFFIRTSMMKIPDGSVPAGIDLLGYQFNWRQFFHLPKTDEGMKAGVLALAFLELYASSGRILACFSPPDGLTATKRKILDSLPDGELNGEKYIKFIEGYTRNVFRLFG